jgi:hypothetical protein
MVDRLGGGASLHGDRVTCQTRPERCPNMQRFAKMGISVVSRLPLADPAIRIDDLSATDLHRSTLLCIRRAVGR